MLHYDNASSYTIEATRVYLKENRVKFIEHLFYSLILTMCDLWLFFTIKKNLLVFRLASEEKIDFAIREYFNKGIFW